MDEFPFQENFDRDMEKVKAELNLAPGDIYEDCSFHPVLCVEVDYKRDDISGISLIDGTHPRSCSLRFCGVRKLLLEEALGIKLHGPAAEEDRERIPEEKRWWFGSREE